MQKPRRTLRKLSVLVALLGWMGLSLSGMGHASPSALPARAANPAVVGPGHQTISGSGRQAPASSELSVPIGRD